MRYIFASGFATLVELGNYVDTFQPDNIRIVWDKFFTPDEFARVLGYGSESNASLAS